jgi:hypothetical protein
MEIKNFINRRVVYDIDTKAPLFELQMYYSDEKNIYGYKAVRLGKEKTEIGTKFFLDYVKPLQVIAAFKKDIREKKIKL